MDQDTNDDILEEEQYAEEVGSVAFESALMKFLATQTEEAILAFNAFIESYVEKETFLEDLCLAYPEFEKILQEEMLLLQKELAEIDSE
jgi:hypothetical protein